MTGWQQALADYQAGKGGYIVPDPNQVNSCQELLEIKGKLVLWRDDLKVQIKKYNSDSNLQPIATLINSLTKKINEYDAAIQACYVAPATTGAGATDDAGQSTVDGGGSTPASTLNPNGPAATQANANSKNKKIIIGGLIAVAVLIAATIIIRKRMKK